MRVVLDTNVLVSAFLFGGQPLDILYLVEQAVIEPVTSQEALSELRDVLNRDKFADRLRDLGLTPDEIVSAHSEAAMLVVPAAEVDVCDDAADNVFISIALAGEADIIVSGDQHLLGCSDKSPVPVVTASEFLLMLRDLIQVRPGVPLPSSHEASDNDPDYCAENTEALLTFLRSNLDVRLVSSSRETHTAQFSIRFQDGVDMEQRVREFTTFLADLDAEIVDRRDHPPHNVLVSARFPPESFNLNWESDGTPTL